MTQPELTAEQQAWLTQMPVPKFAIGDKVWGTDTKRKGERYPCPDCQDTKTWKATTPAGETFNVVCPRCTEYGRLADLPSLTFTRVIGLAFPLTIGKVDTSVTSGEDSAIRYMCKETGIGSGRVYGESTLFATYDDAMAAAQKESTTEQEFVAAAPHMMESAHYADAPVKVAVRSQYWSAIWNSWSASNGYREALEALSEDKSLTQAQRDKVFDGLDSKKWTRPHALDKFIETVRIVKSALLVADPLDIVAHGGALGAALTELCGADGAETPAKEGETSDG